jgi:hypothetical protein
MNHGLFSARGLRIGTALVLAAVETVVVVVAVAARPSLYTDPLQALVYYLIWAAVAIVPAVFGLAVLRDWRLGWLGAGAIGVFLVFLGMTSLSTAFAPGGVLELALGLVLLGAVLVRSRPAAGGTPAERRSG